MNKKILLTGGTGFFGKSILDMVKRGEITGYDFTILSRDPEKFLQNCPEFAGLSGISFIAGDVRDFAAPDGSFDYMILGATPASLNVPDDEMSSIIIDGTNHSLEVASRCQVKKLLFISSGAVYGRQSVPNVPETAPCEPFTAYGKAKLQAEKLCFKSAIPAVTARCFAFTGKYLDRNIHFAIGNFIRDALAGKTVTVKGDGTPLRSYLYADDLVRWLFNLLERGVPGMVYNVGSGKAVSIAELARKVAGMIPGSCGVKIMQTPPPGAAGVPYVPDVTLSQLAGVSSESVTLDEAIVLSAGK